MRFLDGLLRILLRLIHSFALVVFILAVCFVVFPNRYISNRRAQKDIFYEKLGVASSVVIDVTEDFGTKHRFSFAVDSDELLKYLPKVNTFSKKNYTKISPIYICRVVFSDKDVHMLEFYRGKYLTVDGVFVYVGDDALLGKILSYSPYEKTIHPAWYKPLYP